MTKIKDKTKQLKITNDIGFYFAKYPKSKKEKKLTIFDIMIPKKYDNNEKSRNIDKILYS